MNTHALGQRVLIAAAREIGGTLPLARYLCVEIVVLERWRAGREVPPAATVLRAVELMVDLNRPLSS